MGSKYRLLPWIYEVLAPLDFDTALDAFSGSGCVAYLLKAMGKQVVANDLLQFCSVVATATIANPGITLDRRDVEFLLAYDPTQKRFIESTFADVFFTREDLRFLDRVWANVPKLHSPHKRALAIAGMIRSCAKRQPRGVFTVAGDPTRYKDGRRDLRLGLRDHFVEQVEVYNCAVFDNGRANSAICGDVFALDPRGYDLVYLDPPYVPRADDNCYVKRYHFLEGLSCYWKNMDIMQETRVKKIPKHFTPFSYRRTAVAAFENLFAMFSASTIVLSYSSNGFPDLDCLVSQLRAHKRRVTVHKRPHRYHFGTHRAAVRNNVTEYLIVGA
ncbi:MAG: DNA adenine methylase [Phycisphaerales bacterium]|nr:DNA adenine methylase [Phycisphaerales bacterium]